MSEYNEDGTRPATKEELDLARAQLQSDDVQFDDDAVVSEIPGSKNIWVSAWVMVVPS